MNNVNFPKNSVTFLAIKSATFVFSLLKNPKNMKIIIKKRSVKQFKRLSHKRSCIGLLANGKICFTFCTLIFGRTRHAGSSKSTWNTQTSCIEHSFAPAARAWCLPSDLGSNRIFCRSWRLARSTDWPTTKMAHIHGRPRKRPGKSFIRIARPRRRPPRSPGCGGSRSHSGRVGSPWPTGLRSRWHRSIAATIAP